MALADMGARVIKVEDPRGGDMTRRWRPPEFDGESTYYLSVNRRKESACVDLDTASGQEFVRRWAGLADVLVENFLPGALERRGLAVSALLGANPRLVVCSISGYGEAGPLAAEPGFDLLAQGATGLMSITGPPHGEPHKVGVALADVLTGWSAVAAILGALRARDRDGHGSHVRVNLFASTLAALVNVGQGALLGDDAARYGNAHPSIEPYRAFHAKDGGFLLAIGTDRQFELLCKRVLARPELARDPRFLTNADRVRHREALAAALDPLFLEGPRAHWLRLCRESGIPAGPIATVKEALSSAQASATGRVVRVTREGHEPLLTIAPPIAFDGFSEPPRMAPPRLDEDGDRLFAEVGLARAGVCGRAARS